MPKKKEAVKMDKKLKQEAEKKLVKTIVEAIEFDVREGGVVFNLTF